MSKKIIKLLVFAKAVDGGTGTYLESLLGLGKMFSSNCIIKVMVLNHPRYRTIKFKNYSYFYKRVLPHDRYSLNLGTIIDLFREMVWFRNGVKTFKPDIVITFDAHAILLSSVTKVILAESYGVINVIHNNLKKVIDYRCDRITGTLIKRTLSYFLNRSGLVVAVSKDLARALVSDFSLKSNPQVIPGTVPSSFLKEHKITKPKGNIVVNISRLDSQKDHKTLIDAFKIVAQKIPNSQLWLIGDGPQLNEIKKQAQQFKLTNRIKFLGWKQNPAKVLEKAAVFVLSSRWEGLPLTMLEAMSIGIPVVAADCPYGPSEILEENKFGILVPSENPDRMSSEIIGLLSDSTKWKHYSKMGRRRVKAYSLRAMLRRYRNVISNL
jgi:glycosyltransferase involved in cell wall biosynthesis